MCGESRLHGVEWGKNRRLFQRFTYHYNWLLSLRASFRRDVLKETLDSNGVFIESSNVETENFALLFEFDGDVRKIRHGMYYCSASRPTIESQTNEDEIEVKTEKLTIKAAPLGNGLVKAKTGDDTNDEVYLNWYSEVYLPNAVIGGEAEFIAMQD